MVNSTQKIYENNFILLGSSNSNKAYPIPYDFILKLFEYLPQTDIVSIRLVKRDFYNLTKKYRSQSPENKSQLIFFYASIEEKYKISLTKKEKSLNAKNPSKLSLLINPFSQIEKCITKTLKEHKLAIQNPKLSYWEAWKLKYQMYSSQLPNENYEDLLYAAINEIILYAEALKKDLTEAPLNPKAPMMDLVNRWKRWKHHENELNKIANLFFKNAEGLWIDSVGSTHDSNHLFDGIATAYRNKHEKLKMSLNSIEINIFRILSWNFSSLVQTTINPIEKVFKPEPNPNRQTLINLCTQFRTLLGQPFSSPKYMRSIQTIQNSLTFDFELINYIKSYISEETHPILCSINDVTNLFSINNLELKIKLKVDCNYSNKETPLEANIYVYESAPYQSRANAAIGLLKQIVLEAFLREPNNQLKLNIWRKQSNYSQPNYGLQSYIPHKWRLDISINYDKDNEAGWEFDRVNLIFGESKHPLLINKELLPKPTHLEERVNAHKKLLNDLMRSSIGYPIVSILRTRYIKNPQ